MNITKSQVEARKDQLIIGRDQQLANISAYNGAIEDCDYWLEVLDHQEDQEDQGE